VGGKQNRFLRLITLTVAIPVVRIVPTRGMAVLDVVRKNVAGEAFRFGWDSPVKEVRSPEL